MPMMEAVKIKNCAITIQTPAAISCSGWRYMPRNARITAAKKEAVARCISYFLL